MSESAKCGQKNNFCVLNFVDGETLTVKKHKELNIELTYKAL